MASIKSIAMIDLESPALYQPGSTHDLTFLVIDQKEIPENLRKEGVAAVLAHNGAMQLRTSKEMRLHA